MPLLALGLSAPVVHARDGGWHRDDGPTRLWSETVAEMPPGPGVYFANSDHSLFAAQYERLVAGGRPDIAVANAELCRDLWFVQHLRRSLAEIYVPFLDDGVTGDIAERLAVTNLRRGLPVGGDEPAFGRLLPTHASPRGRGYLFGLAPGDADDSDERARPPPDYAGDVGARVAGRVGVVRGLYEASRGRLADAARAAGALDRFADDAAALAAARPSRERPALFGLIPRTTRTRIWAPWQTALLADDLAWAAGLPIAERDPEVRERRIHAAWRALLAAPDAADDAAPDATADTNIAAARARIRELGRDVVIATAQMLAAVGRPAQAEAFLRDALRDRPDLDLLLMLGSVVGNRGTPEALAEAESVFADATRLAPDSADAWARLGLAQAKRGDIAAARASWTRAAALDPTRKDVASWLRQLTGADGE